LREAIMAKRTHGSEDFSPVNGLSSPLLLDLSVGPDKERGDYRALFR
jgi:hypothetical protein